MDSSGDFGVELLQQIHATAPGSNVVVSPLSVSVALGMTLAGARKKTLKQMAKVLHLGDVGGSSTAFVRGTCEQYRDQRASLLRRRGSDDARLSIANALLVRSGFALSRDYQQAVRTHFSALLEQWTTGPDGVAKTNAFVAKETHDMIPSILDSLDEDDRVVLVNAVFFQGTWRHPFVARLTSTATFSCDDGSTRDVPMMSLPGKTLPYHCGKKAAVVSLPYKGALVATLVLPHAGTPLDEFVGGMQADKLARLVGRAQPSKGNVYVPRFKLEWGAPLNAALVALGMRDAFDQDKADFSGMTGQRDLMISQVIHKAVMEVDEKGTKAAAATAVVMKLRGCAMQPETPWEFRADHPFLFLIHRPTAQRGSLGDVLFLAAVHDPPAL